MILIGPRSTLSWSSQLTSRYQLKRVLRHFGSIHSDQKFDPTRRTGNRGIVGDRGFWCARRCTCSIRLECQPRHEGSPSWLFEFSSSRPQLLVIFGVRQERRGLRVRCLAHGINRIHEKKVKKTIYSSSKMKHIVHTSGHYSWFTNWLHPRKHRFSTLRPTYPSTHWVPDPNDPTLDFSLLYDWRDLP